MQRPEPPTRIYRPQPAVPEEMPGTDDAPVRIYPPAGEPPLADAH